jgi:hypothetical protein
VTAITATGRDGRDSTDVRYPPFGTAIGILALINSGGHIGESAQAMMSERSFERQYPAGPVSRCGLIQRLREGARPAG